MSTQPIRPTGPRRLGAVLYAVTAAPFLTGAVFFAAAAANPDADTVPILLAAVAIGFLAAATCLLAAAATVLRHDARRVLGTNERTVLLGIAVVGFSLVVASLAAVAVVERVPLGLVALGAVGLALALLAVLIHDVKHGFASAALLSVALLADTSVKLV